MRFKLIRENGNFPEKKSMNSKVFVDTNILVYLFSETEPHKKQRAFELLGSKNVVISPQVIGEFVWVMHRKFGVEREKLEIIGSRFLKKFEVVPIDTKVVEKALKIFASYKFSYWDSLIIATALEADCGILYTEDMQSGQVIESKLKIVNPFEAN